MTAHLPLIAPIFIRIDCRDAAREAAVMGVQLILQAMEMEAQTDIPAEVVRSVWLSAGSRFHEASIFCCTAFDHASPWEAQEWEDDES